MYRKVHSAYVTFVAILVLIGLVSCSSPPNSPATLAIKPTHTESISPTQDMTAVAEVNGQATLSANMTQNAAHAATSAAMLTATSQAKPPTATSTQPPTEIPPDEVPGVMTHGNLVHFADIQTGLDDIDQIIDIVLAGDVNAFRQRIQFTLSGCTHEMALGGPPKCREGESEGAPVEVLPFLGPEGHFLRRDEVSTWQGIDVAGLYAVFLVSDEAYSNEDYPAGEYGIAFRTKDPKTIVTLQVENGRILRIDALFGTPPEINFDRDAQEIILPPPNTNTGCPGSAPQRVTISDQANVCTQSQDLILRAGPGTDGQALIGIETGGNLLIIDGPACANNWIWWKVELDSGLKGWVAEGGDEVDPYFVCPTE